MLWHFEILACLAILGVSGNQKMWNTSKMIVKRNGRKVGTWGTTVHIYGTFDARILEFGLGSFGALCKILDSAIFDTLCLQQFTLNFNQT